MRVKAIRTKRKSKWNYQKWIQNAKKTEL